MYYTKFRAICFFIIKSLFFGMHNIFFIKDKYVFQQLRYINAILNTSGIATPVKYKEPVSTFSILEWNNLFIHHKVYFKFSNRRSVPYQEIPKTKI